VAQYYVNPDDVEVDLVTNIRPSRRLIRILERDGQIVPVLVRNHDGRFIVTNFTQAERVLAFRELKWPTILIEDNWTEDDL